MNNIPFICLISMIILFCIAGFFFIQRCNTKTLEAFTSQVVSTSTETDTGNVYIFDKTHITKRYSEDNKNIIFEIIRHKVKDPDDLKIEIKGKDKDNNEIDLDIDNTNIFTSVNVDNNSLIIGIKDENELDQLHSITITVINDRSTTSATDFKCSSINLYENMPNPNKTEQISTLHSKCKSGKSGKSSCVVHNSILDSTTNEKIILDKCVDSGLDKDKSIKSVYCPTEGKVLKNKTEISQCNLAKPYCSIINDASGFKCVDSSVKDAQGSLVSIIECNTKLNKNNKQFSYSLNDDNHGNLLKYYGDYSGTLEHFITKLNGSMEENVVEHTITYKNDNIIQYQDSGGNQKLLKNLNVEIRNKENEENKELIFTIDTDIEATLPPFFIHYIDSDISDPTTSATITPSSSSVSASSQSINPLLSTTVSLELTNPAGLTIKPTLDSRLPTLPTLPTSFTNTIETITSSNNIPSFSEQSPSSSSSGSTPSLTDPFVGSMELNNNNNNKPQSNHFFDLNTTSDISKNLNKLEAFYGGPTISALVGTPQHTPSPTSVSVPTVSKPIVHGITPNMGARINHPQLDNSILN